MGWGDGGLGVFFFSFFFFWFVDILAGNDVSEFNSKKKKRKKKKKLCNKQVLIRLLYSLSEYVKNEIYFDFRRDNTNSESHLIVHHSETAESVDCCNSLGTVTVSKLQTL